MALHTQHDPFATGGYPPYTSTGSSRIALESIAPSLPGMEIMGEVAPLLIVVLDVCSLCGRRVY